MPKSAKVILVTFAAMFFFIAAGAAQKSTLMIGLGVILFVANFVLIAIFSGKQNSAAGGKSGTAKVNASQFHKYLPLLNDERTKLHPEVQVLLQYTEVQRAFFDPNSLSNSATANDEHVQELFRVFDEILAQGAINGNIYGNLPNQAQNYPQNTINPANPYQIPKNGSEDKKTIRKAGKIMRFVGIGMFVLPFGLVFTLVGLNPGAPWTGTAISIVVSGACPMGMLLIIVGTVLGR